MSGIYIHGVEMPTDGRTWCLVIARDGKIRVPTGDGEFAVVDGAKAIPVPPHGRLIDADALMDSLLVDYPSVVSAIDTAPTIIPADKGAGE